MKCRFARLACSALLLAAANAQASHAADAKNGKAIFVRCAACHTDAKGAPNGVGPNLFGVLGRKAASRPDFSYSGALKSSGIVWTNQKLDPWIADPMQVVPGTRMAFGGISDPKQRADLIAYLDTLK
jgi:cytochrome c